MHPDTPNRSSGRGGKFADWIHLGIYLCASGLLDAEQAAGYMWQNGYHPLSSIFYKGVAKGQFDTIKDQGKGLEEVLKHDMRRLFAFHSPIDLDANRKVNSCFNYALYSIDVQMNLLGSIDMYSEDFDSHFWFKFVQKAVEYNSTLRSEKLRDVIARTLFLLYGAVPGQTSVPVSIDAALAAFPGLFYSSRVGVHSKLPHSAAAAMYGVYMLHPLSIKLQEFENDPQATEATLQLRERLRSGTLPRLSRGLPHLWSLDMLREVVAQFLWLEEYLSRRRREVVPRAAAAQLSEMLQIHRLPANNTSK